MVSIEAMRTTIPFDEIPDDVLLEIFILTRLSSGEGSSLSFLVSASLLLQVCKRWKNVALSCSELWTQVSIQMRLSNFIAARLKDATQLLERSKHRPLNMVIGIPYSKLEWVNGRPTKTPRPTPFKEPHSLNQLLRPVAARLQSIFICGTALKDIFDIDLGTLNKLERAVLDLSPTIMEQYRKRPKVPANAPARLKVFQHAPQLRRIAVTNHYVGHELLDVPWEQLTHFLELQRLDKQRAEDFIFTNLMKRCTKLRHLATTLCRREGVGQFNGQPYILEEMKYLTINCWTLGTYPAVWRYVDEIFRRFKLPGLTSLRITANFIDNFTLEGPWIYSAELIEVLNGLEYLSLTCAVDNGHEHYLLRLTPKLRTLDIHFAFSDDEYGTSNLFKHLAAKEDNGKGKHCLAPLLDTLVIDVSTFPPGSILPGVREFNGHQLRKMLHFRTEGRAGMGAARPFKVVVYTAGDLSLAPASDLFDMEKEDWVAVLNEFARDGKIQFETRMITATVRLCSSQKNLKNFHAGGGWWMCRAPELEDWPEAKELVKGLAE